MAEMHFSSNEVGKSVTLRPTPKFKITKLMEEESFSIRSSSCGGVHSRRLDEGRELEESEVLLGTREIGGERGTSGNKRSRV